VPQEEVAEETAFVICDLCVRRQPDVERSRAHVEEFAVAMETGGIGDVSPTVWSYKPAWGWERRPAVLF
jgi:hypothetical protein